MLRLVNNYEWKLGNILFPLIQMFSPYLPWLLFYRPMKTRRDFWLALFIRYIFPRVFLLNWTLSVTTPNKICWNNFLHWWYCVPKEINRIRTVNIVWGDCCSESTIMRRVLHSLSLPSLKILHHSNTRVLEGHASPNCFSSLWKISSGCITSSVRNLIIMRCSTLTDTFRSFISLLELGQDWISLQLPEREGREATSLSKVNNVLDGVLWS